MISTDIKYYHSGGGANCDIAADLGGAISTCQLSGPALNNLFNDVSPSTSRIGQIDYRCLYIKNTSSSETLRDANLYVSSERKSGSLIALGITVREEIHRLLITGTKPPNEGDSMTLLVPGYSNFTVPYHVNPTIWQGRFQTEIRAIDGLQGVRVVVSGTVGFPTSLSFIIYYTGQAVNKDLGVIQVISSSLDGQTLTPTRPQIGTPVNSTAVTIANSTTAPAGISFAYPGEGSPIELGSLRPSDMVPIWVKRITPANTTIFLVDNFVLNLDGTFP